MKSQDVRRSFIEFFVGKDHRHLPSASLVPEGMSTTLFTIAGMEPFVPVFLGNESPPAPRVVTVQRCLRVAGGKSDLENVGRSGHHGTFLEMLGNFSFGDYYKREAIAWAWEYLTQTLSLPIKRLWATVYVDDDEAEEIWRRDIGLLPDRISRFREENFWDMGPTGPCGPSSEIFYDLGPTVGCGKATCGPNCPDCNRYIELGNLVFQQFDRDAAGRLHPLPKKCIDTGMGFERLCMVLAGKTSIFDTDLYQDIIRELPPVDLKVDRYITSRDAAAVHQNIIADHARAATFLVADGVTPSNTDRGYVLRFLIRRAIRSGRVLGYADRFFSALAPAVIGTLVDGYPELQGADDRVVAMLAAEERQFDQTLERGSRRLTSVLETLSERGDKQLGGRDVFELHDTYGFPPELTAEIARDAGFGVDMAGYRAAMEEQRERARRDARAKRAEVRVMPAAGPGDLADSVFVGYESLEAKARIAAIFDKGGASVKSLETGAEGAIVLDQTPFYAERGGQMGDRGVLAREGATFAVADSQYQDKTYRRVLHAGKVREGAFAVGDVVDAIVDPAWRREIRRHHTATHLLQRALKDVVGESVAQRGSAVYPDRARFDFDSPSGALTRQQRGEVGGRVNEFVRSDYHISVETMPFDEAVARGAIYMKGEQYGDIVRVVRFGPSIELCGGTHVESTGEIGHFVLLDESAIGAGIRRVEGLASESAERYLNRLREAAEQAGTLLTVPVERLPETATKLAQRQRELEKTIAELRAQVAALRAVEYLSQAKEIDGVPYLTVRADELGPRELAESIRARLRSGVVVVGASTDGKASLIVTVSEDVAAQGLSAKAILAAIVGHVEGRGGGTDTSAQGGGPNAAGIDAALAAVPDAIRATRRR